MNTWPKLFLATDELRLQLLTVPFQSGPTCHEKPVEERRPERFLS